MLFAGVSQDAAQDFSSSCAPVAMSLQPMWLWCLSRTAYVAVVMFAAYVAREGLFATGQLVLQDVACTALRVLFAAQSE